MFFFCREFTSPTPGYGPVHPPRPSRGSLNRSSSDGAANNGKANNGSLSDTALGGSATEQGAKQSQQHVSGKIPQFGGLSAKRSNSTSQLSVSGKWQIENFAFPQQFKFKIHVDSKATKE